MDKISKLGLFLGGIGLLLLGIAVFGFYVGILINTI